MKGGEDVNALVKKGFILGLIGFAIGVPVGLLYLYLLAPEAFAGQWSAMDVALQLILSGVLGAMAMGFSVVYEADSWSVTRCTVTHALITFGSYFSIGLYLGWFKWGDLATYIMIGSYIVGYFMVWLIMYLISKKQAKTLDEELKEWKKTSP